MKIGDLVRCSHGTEKNFWFTEGIGVIVRVTDNTWAQWEGSTSKAIVNVLWASGKESTISTRWLEVISG